MPRRSSRLHKELRAIGEVFQTLARHFERIAPLLGEHADVVITARGGEGRRTRRKPRLSVRQRAALKLQGKYMGTMRGLTPRDKALVKRVRAERGIRAAIAAARRMGR